MAYFPPLSATQIGLPPKQQQKQFTLPTTIQHYNRPQQQQQQQQTLPPVQMLINNFNNNNNIPSSTSLFNSSSSSNKFVTPNNFYERPTSQLRRASSASACKSAVGRLNSINNRPASLQHHELLFYDQQRLPQISSQQIIEQQFTSQQICERRTAPLLPPLRKFEPLEFKSTEKFDNEELAERRRANSSGILTKTEIVEGDKKLEILQNQRIALKQLQQGRLQASCFLN
uniref:Uncharacterized protein n=1 Tax=Meloidogyne hapla TaxID=6305 RepID=A0A1I8BVE3_MELHA